MHFCEDVVAALLYMQFATDGFAFFVSDGFYLLMTDASWWLCYVWILFYWWLMRFGDFVMCGYCSIDDWFLVALICVDIFLSMTDASLRLCYDIVWILCQLFWVTVPMHSLHEAMYTYRACNKPGSTCILYTPTFLRSKICYRLHMF